MKGYNPVLQLTLPARLNRRSGKAYDVGCRKRNGLARFARRGLCKLGNLNAAEHYRYTLEEPEYHHRSMFVKSDWETTLLDPNGILQATFLQEDPYAGSIQF